MGRELEAERRQFDVQRTDQVRCSNCALCRSDALQVKPSLKALKPPCSAHGRVRSVLKFEII